MAKNRYTADFFIKRFKAIPRNAWTTGDFMNQSEKDGKALHCALGHCGATDDNTLDLIEPGTPMSMGLVSLFLRTIGVPPHEVNDTAGKVVWFDLDTRRHNYTAVGKHPRTRILNALREIKKLEASK